MAGLGAGAAVLAASLVTTGVLASHPNVPRDTAAVGPPAPTTSAVTAPTAIPAPEVLVYAAAIDARANKLRMGDTPWPVVYVEDRTCANVITPVQGGCEPRRPLPPSVRDGLPSAMAGYAPVLFVTDGREVIDPQSVVVNGGVLVTLGPATIDGGEARVPLSVHRNGLNGQGVTYRLLLKGRDWHVEGTVGPSWIS